MFRVTYFDDEMKLKVLQEEQEQEIILSYNKVSLC